MMYILIRNYTVHFNSQITSELRKSISTSLVNQQLTERANLDSNATVFYHASITG
mgnify:CR=1 FL=1